MIRFAAFACLLAGAAQAGSDALEAAVLVPLAEAHPEYAAGLVDCLSFLEAGHDVEIGQAGQVLGEGFAYSIFYPQVTQPIDFVVAVSSSGGVLNCSGQGALALPSEVSTQGADGDWVHVEALLAAAGMVELAFPAPLPLRAYGNCDAGRAMLFSDNAGLLIFAGFTGANADQYCTTFGPKG